MQSPRSLGGSGAIPVAFAASVAATPSFAFPHINVTNSEVLSTTPLRVRTSFTFEEVGYHACCYGAAFYVTSSGAGPTVHFYGGEGNADFDAYLQSDAMVSFEIRSMAAYEGIHAFAINTDQTTPCVELTFWDPILSKTPGPKVANDYVVRGCLAVDMPTPVHPTTWGSMKSLYR